VYPRSGKTDEPLSVVNREGQGKILLVLGTMMMMMMPGMMRLFVQRHCCKMMLVRRVRAYGAKRAE